MTAPVALLVTGSRSLAKDPKAEAWARAILNPTIAELPPWSVVVHGGAIGPDRWAQESAEFHVRGVPLLTYVLFVDGEKWVVTLGAGLHVNRVRWTEAKNQDPLVRNRHMVNVEMPALVGRGYKPRVLALVDSTSRTKGTGHTVGLARKAGYPVDRRVWEVKP